MSSRTEHLGDGVVLHLADCLDILPTLTGIDHVFTDPPYEDELHEAMGEFRRADGKRSGKALGFDGINANRDAVAAAMVTASSGWLIAFTLAEGVRAWRDGIQAAAGKYDTCLFWVKPDASPRFNGQGAARGAECAVTAWCGRGHRHWNGGGRRGVFTHPVNVGRQGEHPTEKPLPLMADLVTLYSNPGETICDPFMGSGTTGVAAVRHGRRFVGIERDPRWFDLACRRISDELRRPDLFVARPAPAIQQPLFAEA